MMDSTGAHESAPLPNRERAEEPNGKSNRKQVAEGAPQPSVAVAPTTREDVANARECLQTLGDEHAGESMKGGAK